MLHKKGLIFFCTLLCFCFFQGLFGAEQDTSKIPELIQQKINASSETFTFRYQLRLIAFLFVISLIPFALMMLTSFTRISIIFHFLRQALGSPQVPSNQIVIGISLILTGFVMHPVINEIQSAALVPYLNNTLQKIPEVRDGSKTEETVFIERAWKPLRVFLLQHAREKDLQLFLEIANAKNLNSEQGIEYKDVSEYQIDDIPWYCIVPAFVMSELRIAFMIGFLLFLPFLIIDMVIASVLMSMGMMMLPPVLVSTPFKLLLFILIDGWRLIIQQIVNGYYG